MNGLQQRGSKRQLWRIRGGGARTRGGAPQPHRLLLDTDSHYFCRNRKRCKGEAGRWAVVGKDIDFEAALVWHAQQKHDPQIIKYHLLLWSSQCIITFNVCCTNDSLKACGSDNQDTQDGTADELAFQKRRELTLGVLRSIDSVLLCRSDDS